uniref:CWH43-like N-terminal domain-containing protein n=1 Tax=Aquila chrysaetos chrysaetos TaxID=223781 RepID=A0A663ETN2_AQUCH
RGAVTPECVSPVGSASVFWEQSCLGTSCWQGWAPRSRSGITTSRVAGTAPAPAARWTTSPSSASVAPCLPRAASSASSAAWAPSWVSARCRESGARSVAGWGGRRRRRCTTGLCFPPAVILVGLLRYAHLLERLGPSLLNTLGLATGWVCAAGLTMVGNFQVDHAKVLHYIGAGVAFPTSMLFLLLQSILTYRMAKTRGQYWTGHLRSILTAVAFLTLVFSGVFFIQESFVLQHVAALCEWMFIIDVLVFYGTFTFEFGAISTDTFLVLLKASRAPKSYKGESGVSSTAHIHSHAEGLAMA